MILTSRQKKILNIILKSDSYVTIGEIASNLSVSGRTVLREMNSIEDYLSSLGEELERKTGYGIRFVGDEEQRNDLFFRIMEEKEQVIYTKEERRLIILSILLKSKEPLKTYVLTKRLRVTDVTISADLDKCQQWLETNGIELIRKPGVGVYINGNEQSIRRAMINLFYENFDYGSFTDFESDDDFVQKMAGGNILNIFEKGMLIKVKNFIDCIDDIPFIKVKDKNYIGIIMHLCLILTRIKNGEAISMNNKILDELKSYNEYKIALKLVKGLEDIFKIHISDYEVGYLVMILRGSQGLQFDKSQQADNQAKEIVDQIINIAESKTGYLIETNSTFYNGLLSHIVPTINRLKMNLDIRNPLLNDIKQHYAYLFELAQSCSKVIEKTIGKPVPEAEIGYIAMHLGVALENKGVRRQRIYKAIICCPTGMVSARLLSIRVEREFSNIEVIDIVSTTNIETDIFEHKNAEFIISTFPMQHTKVPSITVSPFLLDDDKEKVQEFLQSLEKNKSLPVSQSYSNQNIKEYLSDFKEYIDAILQILNSFFFIKDIHINNVDDLIEMVALKTSKTTQDEHQIKADLINREKYGSTIVEQSKLMILHCKTTGVSHLHFGIIKPRIFSLSGLSGKQQQVNLVLVMLAPKDCPKSHIEVMGSISQGLVDHEGLINTLLTGSETECYSIIEKLMSQYYEAKRLNI